MAPRGIAVAGQVGEQVEDAEREADEQADKGVASDEKGAPGAPAIEGLADEPAEQPGHAADGTAVTTRIRMENA